MLTLIQLAINALNEFDLHWLIDTYDAASGEFCQGILDSEIYVERNSNENQVNWGHLVHHLNEAKNMDFTIFETIDITREITQIGDSLLQRIEEPHMNLIYGHRSRDILEHLRLAGVIATVLTNKFGASPTNNQCGRTRNDEHNRNENEKYAENIPLLTNNLMPSPPPNLSGTFRSDRSQPRPMVETLGLRSNAHLSSPFAPGHPATIINPDDHTRNELEESHLTQKVDTNLFPFSGNPKPPQLCDTPRSDRSRPEPIVGPPGQKSNSQFNISFKTIFPVNRLMENLSKFFSVDYFSISHFESRERNWKKRRRKQ